MSVFTVVYLLISRGFLVEPFSKAPRHLFFMQVLL